MGGLVVVCGVVGGAVVGLAHSPSVRVIAQEESSPRKSATQAAADLDPQKDARIRELMDVTGAKDMGQQLIEAGMEQFRSSVLDSQPDNPRAKQFVDAFVVRFQKHFDADSLNERVIPIYDKYLTAQDLQGLLDYYRSPLGQRMLKVLPEETRESQEACVDLGNKAAHETMG